MADSDDLELGSEDDPSGNGGVTSGRTHPVRKRINIKLRPAAAATNKGRAGMQAGKKTSKVKGSEKVQHSDSGMAENRRTEEQEADVEQFGDDVERAMQFTAAVKLGGVSTEPFHKNQKLKWDHKVNLIGEKIIDPLIHSCEKCSLPILIYGRMIPCKHVFCYSCAKMTEKICPRCNQPVVRIEQAALGTVFVCTVGGTKHGVSGCHRTYLSQRDLQSHIAHRHFGAGREPAARPAALPPAQAEFLSAPPSGAVCQQQPSGAPLLTFNVSQPPPTLVHDGTTLMYRQQQQAPPPHSAGPPPPHTGGALPPQMVVGPPPQHILSPHGTHVMNTGPPPGMMQAPLAPPPNVQALGPPPQAVLVQQVAMGGHGSSSRPTNLITVHLHDESDYRRGAESQNSGGRSSFTNPPPPVSQSVAHDNPMSHYPPQHYPPHGPPPQVTYAGQDQQHQLTVHSMMTHPGAPPPNQLGPPPSAQMAPPPAGLVSMTLPPTHMAPPGGPPPQRLGPPPQSMHSGPPPQGMHSGPPPQGMHGGPPPQNIHSGPPPQQVMHSGPPPQGMRSGPPPPQGMRSGPPPHGYPGPPPPQHHEFQSWQNTAPPPSSAQQRLPHQNLPSVPPGSRPSPGPSQSMPYYQ